MGERARAGHSAAAPKRGGGWRASVRADGAAPPLNGAETQKRAWVAWTVCHARARPPAHHVPCGAACLLPRSAALLRRAHPCARAAAGVQDCERCGRREQGFCPMTQQGARRLPGLRWQAAAPRQPAITPRAPTHHQPQPRNSTASHPAVPQSPDARPVPRPARCLTSPSTAPTSGPSPSPSAPATRVRPGSARRGVGVAAGAAGCRFMNAPGHLAASLKPSAALTTAAALHTPRPLILLNRPAPLRQATTW